MKPQVLLLFLAFFVESAFGESLILPQIVTGPNWTTKIRIINTSAGDQSAVKVTVYQDWNGMRPWANLAFCPTRGGAGTICPATNEGGEFFTPLILRKNTLELYPTLYANQTSDIGGYLMVESFSLKDIKISAYLIYHPTGRLTSLVGVLDSPLVTDAAVPADADTAIAVVNPSDKEILVKFLIFFPLPGGNWSTGFSINLRPREHRAFFLKEKVKELVPGSKDPLGGDASSLGYASIQSVDPFAIMALIFTADGLVSSLPVHVIK